MRLTLLGTGAAGGVPLYGCDCPACTHARRDPAHLRRPCSALLASADIRILIDAGLSDLADRFPAGSLSAILLTHFHTDHVQGLFHLRWGVGEPIPVLCPPDPEGCADLYRHPGLLDFRPLSEFKPQRLGPFSVIPLPLNHSRPSFGYAIEGPGGARLAYLTDTLGLPTPTADFLRRWGDFRLVLDATYPPMRDPVNHNDLTSALSIIAEIKPRRSWLTHLSHEHDAWRMGGTSSLPPNVSYALDDEWVEIGN